MDCDKGPRKLDYKLISSLFTILRPCVCQIFIKLPCGSCHLSPPPPFLGHNTGHRNFLPRCVTLQKMDLGNSLAEIVVLACSTCFVHSLPKKGYFGFRSFVCMYEHVYITCMYAWNYCMERRSFSRRFFLLFLRRKRRGERGKGVIRLITRRQGEEHGTQRTPTC